MFKALLLENQDGKTVPTLTRLAESQLPEGEVRVAVAYSSINYKDGLAITGKGKIVRQWPLVPGIDFAGTVLESADSRYQTGGKVVLTGWGVGEGHWGGMAEQARVKGDWLVPSPSSFCIVCSITNTQKSSLVRVVPSKSISIAFAGPEKPTGFIKYDAFTP